MAGLRLTAVITCAILLADLGIAAPAVDKRVVNQSSTTPSSTVSAAAAAAETMPYASDDPNNVLWGLDYDGTPDAVRGSYGASILGPHNGPMAIQNPDMIAPPTTDHGSIANAKWPFSLSHNRLQTGGWARQQNVNVMPLATSMAGVNMRLEPGAVRELHWHKTAEWAYVLKGSVQVSVVNTDGKGYTNIVSEGDLWYFPAGIPHTLQATDDNPGGAEFVLVFDDGAFSEDSTFEVTDWLAHVPKEVVAKNFQTDVSAFAHIPGEELYLFPTAPPSHEAQATVENPFTFQFSKVAKTKLSGGSVKTVDSSTFKMSKTIAAAEITVEPGAMRELHWHPTEDEWSFFLEGQGRITLFGARGNARTFNYQAGDIGFVPATFGHYVENTGNTTLRFLEIFKAEAVRDISLSQWLALTPPALVKAHLQLDDATIAKLSKSKPIVVGPS